jgi:hypothetical protein
VAAQVNGPVAGGTDTYPGALRVLVIDIPDAATGDVDRVMDVKVRVLGCKVVKTGGAGAAGNYYQLKNTADVITEEITGNLADTHSVEASDFVAATRNIDAGGTLRVTRTRAGGNAAAQLTVYMVPVA